MINMSSKCAECGGDYGIHHSETNQCPVNGVEAAVGRKQEWQSTTFVPETSSEIDNLKAQVKKLLKRIEQLESEVAALKGDQVELVDIGDGQKVHPVILAAILPDEDE